MLELTPFILVIEDDERGPDVDLKHQFEALSQFSPEENKVSNAVIEGLILKHDANRFSAASSSTEQTPWNR